MNCPRCDSPAETQALQQFGGVCPKCLLEFAAEMDAPSFPNLDIVATLGEGGMGVVYKAVQKPLGRTVALKVLSPRLATDPSFVERFTREAKALAQLNHPNIVSIYDFGVHDGVPYLLMEYVDGTPLRKLLAAKKLAPEVALEVVPQICDALHYAHERGVVHRDVKPENILIDRGGRVKIADFGLAKLAQVEQTRITRTNMLMGTPHYMAPEQIENPSAVDHRADIYSLGVIFYEMLTGELPLGRFKPPSARATVDRRLDPVVLKSLEKEPDDRYQSAGEVKDHVTRLEGVRRTDIRKEEKKPPTSPRTLWLASAILTLVTIAFALGREGRDAVIWTGFAAAVCGVVALFRMAPGARPAPAEVQKPAGRLIRVVVRDPLKKAAFMVAVLGLLALLAGVVLQALRLEMLAFVPFALGAVLLFIAFFLVAVTFARGAWGRVAGVTVAAILVLLVLGALVVPMRATSSPPMVVAHARPSLPPPAALPAATTLWEAEMPDQGPHLGVFAAKRSFIAVSAGGVHEFEADTGHYLSRWNGEIAALPVVHDDLIACWSANHLHVLQLTRDGLTERVGFDGARPGKISGVEIVGTLLFGATDLGGAFALDLVTGKLLWNRTDLETRSATAPVVTDLDVVLFDAAGKTVLDRERGTTKSTTIGGGATGKMAQWDQGWAMLTHDGAHVWLKTYFKHSLDFWFGQSPKSTASIQDCEMAFAGEMLLFTTVNEIHAIHKNAPFGDRWGTKIPRTSGKPVAYGDEFVLVPTKEGCLCFRAADGARAPLDLGTKGSSVSLACQDSRIVVLDREKGRLSCYDYPRNR